MCSFDETSPGMGVPWGRDVLRRGRERGAKGKEGKGRKEETKEESFQVRIKEWLYKEKLTYTYIFKHIYKPSQSNRVEELLIYFFIFYS